VDDQGRVDLGAVRTWLFTRYSAEEQPDGTIILRPPVPPAVRQAIAAARAREPSVVSGSLQLPR